jgi:hypothetical protein
MGKKQSSGEILSQSQYPKGQKIVIDVQMTEFNQYLLAFKQDQTPS